MIRALRRTICVQDGLIIGQTTINLGRTAFFPVIGEDLQVPERNIFDS